MCRSIIPFDVTDIGPLFVGSFKNANMIVADRKTKTFFQQASFRSIIGKLHPHELKMIPFQILTWSEVKALDPIPKVVKVTEKDLKEFKLPIPGVWKKIMASESTPGLAAKNRDKSFPARTRVIGIFDPYLKETICYLKKEVKSKKIVIDKEKGYVLVAASKSVNAFKSKLGDIALDLSLEENKIIDTNSGTHWDLRGTFIKGDLKQDLQALAISDEYWFSWIKFRPDSKLIRLD
jgi:hypothetical protein